MSRRVPINLISASDATEEFIVSINTATGRVTSIAEVFSGGTKETRAVTNSGHNVTVTADAPIRVVSGAIDFGFFDRVITGSVVDGLAQADSVVGPAGNDFIATGAGNDTINGGAGVDLMVGGAGDDTYVVNDEDDVVRELANGGIDTVRASADYTLSANVENLTLTGNKAIEAVGNTLNNVITGNGRANRLEGGGGNDTLLGGVGADTLVGGAGDDSLDGGAGVDTALFAGRRALFEVTREADNTVSVENKTDGTRDLLFGVEFIEFADGRLTIGQALNVKPLVSGLTVKADTSEISFKVNDDPADSLRLTTAFNGSFDVAGDVTNNGVTTLVAEQQDSAALTNNLVVNDGLASSDRFARVTQGTAGDDNFAALTLPEGVSAIQFGFDGDDRLRGSNRNDFQVGGDGEDTVLGADGNDNLYGQAGEDLLEGGNGDDTLVGGLGDDVLVGAAGSDSVLGEDGVDFFQAEFSAQGLDADVVDLGGGRFVIPDVADIAADSVQIDYVAPESNEGEVARIQISFISAEVGDGDVDNDFDGLAVSLQLQSRVDVDATTDGIRLDYVAGQGLTGGISRFDDEGMIFSGRNVEFSVIGQNATRVDGVVTAVTLDVAGQNRGVFNEVYLGGNESDVFKNHLDGDNYYLNGGSGNDSLRDGSGQDFLVGGSGNDTLTFSFGDDSAIAGGGNDTVVAGRSNLVADGGLNDALTTVAGVVVPGAGDTLTIDFDRYQIDSEDEFLLISAKGLTVTFNDETQDTTDGTITITRDLEPTGSELTRTARETVQTISFKGFEFFKFNDVTLSLVDLVNDAPTIVEDDTDDEGSVSELADDVESEVVVATTTAADSDVSDESGELTAEGTITFADSNAADKHRVSFESNFDESSEDEQYRGDFAVTLDQANKEVGWTFTVSDEALNDLNANDVLTQSYTVAIEDNKGGRITQVVTITINGTNDTPFIVSADTAADIFEQAEEGGSAEPVEPIVVSPVPTGAPAPAASSTAAPAASTSAAPIVTPVGTSDESVLGYGATGEIVYGDDDRGAMLTAVLAPEPDDYVGTFAIGQDEEKNTVTWSFEVLDRDIAHLPEGVELTQMYTITITDENGASVSQDVTITITGSNDTPTIDATVSVDSVATVDVDGLNVAVQFDDTSANDENTVVVTGTLSAEDIDDGEDGFADLKPMKGEFGTLEVVDGEFTYTADAPYDYLADGEVETDSFTLTTNDGTEVEFVVTINGVNDAPIAANLTLETDEDDGTFTESVSQAVKDAEDDDLTFKLVLGNNEKAPEGLEFNEDGTFALVLGNRFQKLNKDASDTVTFKYKANDGSSDSEVKQVTITIKGLNDAPVAENVDAKFDEGDPMVAKPFMASDVDEVSEGVTESLTYQFYSVDALGKAVFSDRLNLTNEDEEVIGTVTLNEDGDGFVFTPAEGAFDYLPENDTAEVSFQYVADDSNREENSVSEPATVTITVKGLNDLATIEGDTDGSVVERGFATPGVMFDSGELSVLDADAGESTLTLDGADMPNIVLLAANNESEPATVSDEPVIFTKEGVYGTFAISDEGEWTYTLNNDDEDTQALAQGETDDEEFTVRSADGKTTKTVTITVTGSNDAPIVDLDSLSATETGFSFTAIDVDSAPSTLLSLVTAVNGDFDEPGTVNNGEPTTIDVEEDAAVFQTELRVRDDFGAASPRFAVLVQGSSGADSLNRSSASDPVIFYGFGGDDSISASSKNDLLFGGEGNDTLRGNAGDDLLSGGDGNDELFGGEGHDELIGGLGVDVYTTGLGSDVIREVGSAVRDAMTSVPFGENETRPLFDVSGVDKVLDFELHLDTLDASVFGGNPRANFNYLMGTLFSDGTFVGEVGQNRQGTTSQLATVIYRDDDQPGYLHNGEFAVVLVGVGTTDVNAVFGIQPANLVMN